MSRFQTLYREAIVPELIKKFGYKTFSAHTSVIGGNTAVIAESFMEKA